MSIRSAEFGLGAFNCPHCFAFAHQIWLTADAITMKTPVGDSQHIWQLLSAAKLAHDNSGAPGTKERISGVYFSKCEHCTQLSIWVQGKLIFPSSLAFPSPSPDTPEHIESDYREAMQIGAASPRSAAALLRLALQKLLIHLGERGKNVNDDIANLVERG